MEEKEAFQKVFEKMALNNTAIKAGKMMCSPAIVYNKQVFAFFSRQNAMVFRLGKEFEIATSESKTIKVFNPFKNKGPLNGWYTIDYSEQALWEKYTHKAFEFTTRI